MAYFPFFIDLNMKKCVIIGGGEVALRKVEALLEFEASITVVAPCVCEGIQRLEGKINIHEREYQLIDIDEAFLVIAATSDTSLNTEIAKSCKARIIFVNVVDVPEECDFYFPAYIKQGEITVGITTSGSSPIMAGHLKKRMIEAIPDYYQGLVSSLGAHRELVKQRLQDVKARATAFKRLAEIGMNDRREVTTKDVEDVINTLKSDDCTKDS